MSPLTLHSRVQIAELTSMVNNRNRYLDKLPGLSEPPSSSDGERAIPTSGPLWTLDEVIRAVKRHTEQTPTIRLVTEDATKDHEELVEQGFCLKTAIIQLETESRYKGSFWCKTSPLKIGGKSKGTGQWIPCDAYTVNCAFENPNNGYCGVNTYYLKLCMGLTGEAVLFVSTHLS